MHPFSILVDGHRVWYADTWKGANNLFVLASIHYSGNVALVDKFGNIIRRRNLPRKIQDLDASKSQS